MNLRRIPAVKKFFQLPCVLLFVVVLCLGFAAVPAYAQPLQWKPSLNRRASVPPAKDLALLRAKSAHGKFTSYVNSENWSGYVVGSGSGNGFKGVEANWNAPCKSGTANSQIQYGSWVGLGGYFDTNLEQAGIILQSDGTYRMFWEYIWSNGDPPYIDTSDVVHCGDPMTAWVHFGTTYCSNGGFYAHVQDNKTGAHLGSTCLSKSTGYGIQSADWIDERPLVYCGLTELADFNYTQWSNVLAQANYSGAGWANPNNFVNTQLLMYDDPSGNYLAIPDGLHVNSNNTFTDRWYNYGTYC